MSLIFAAAAPDGSIDLSIVATDGSSPATRLLAPGLNGLSAAWSPDGSKLAYVASERPGSAGLSVVEVTAREALAGGIEGDLVRPDLWPDRGSGSGGQPQWSPDGTQLAVAAVPGGFVGDAEGIYIVQADGSGERVLTERAGNPTWSPDGRRLAFHRSIVQMPDDPAPIETSDSSVGVPLHLGFVMVDGSGPPMLLQDAYGSWQPVVAPILPAPTPLAASSAP
jgi:Tol biopolymer transport system component